MDRRSGTGADLSRLRSNQKIRFLKKNEEEISVGELYSRLFSNNVTEVFQKGAI